MMKKLEFTILTIALQLLLPPFAWAKGQLHGFVSQGYSQSSENHVYGDSAGNGSWAFRELGINGSYRQSAYNLFSGQLLSREAGEVDKGELRVDFLIWDRQFYQGRQNRSGVRLGRVKNPLGFYNATRDVPTTRPSIMLPQSIYFDRTRDIALSSDGLNYYFDRNLKMGNLNVELQIARPRIESRQLEAVVFFPKTDTESEFEAKTSYFSKIFYEHAGDGLSIAYSLARYNVEYLGEPAYFRPNILSLQFNSRRWTVTSEYALRKTKFYAKTINGESAYIEATHRFNDSTSAILRYDRIYQDRDDKDGSKYAADILARTGLATPNHIRYAKDWTLGFSWSWKQDWLIRLEHHWVDGTAWLASADNASYQDLEARWRLFLLQVSYQFTQK